MFQFIGKVGSTFSTWFAKTWASFFNNMSQIKKIQIRFICTLKTVLWLTKFAGKSSEISRAKGKKSGFHPRQILQKFCQIREAFCSQDFKNGQRTKQLDEDRLGIQWERFLVICKSKFYFLSSWLILTEMFTIPLSSIYIPCKAAVLWI